MAQRLITTERKYRGRIFVFGALFAAGVMLGLLPTAGASDASMATFAPSADAHVYSSDPARNYGADAFLRIDDTPKRNAYLRFDVHGLAAAPTKATLRFYTLDAHHSGFKLHATGSAWSEQTLTWQTAPAPGALLGSSGGFSAGQWLSFDVTPQITGNGSYGFALVTSSSSSMSLGSREAGADKAPQLILETSGGSMPMPSTPGTTSGTTTNHEPAPTTTTTTTPTTTTAPHEPMPTQPAPTDPTACQGYPEKRVFLESQAWWRKAPGKNGTDFGHLHSGTCFPWGQTLSGVVRFNVRLVMHENPGLLTKLRVQVFHSGAPDPVKLVNLNYRCPSGTCVWWVPVDIDTRLSYDGCHEFRFQGWAKEPDGKELVATTGWRAYIKNGRAVNSYCDARGVNFTEGRGWYTDHGYENGRLDDPLPMNPVSGVWSPKLKAAPGSEGIPTTYHLITIDPDFHNGFRGTVLKEGAGAWGPSRLPIDTTKLSNGRHRLVIRTDANTADGSVLTGILVLPFTVQN